MINNLNVAGDQFLSSLQDLQTRMANTQAQISSGTRISKPSDDPAAVGDVLQLESDLGRVKQVITNLGQVSGEVNTSESALQSATQLMQQVQSLAAAGASSTTSAATRTGLSQQVEQMLSGLVSISRTTFDGTYVFGGGTETSAPYEVDLTSPNGVNRLTTSAQTRQIQDVTGVTFADSRSAQDIFDHRNSDDSLASDNVFAAVNNLRIALGNNDQAGINSAIDSLKTASDYLSQQLAFYGGVQNQVAQATDIAQKFQLQYQTSLSDKKDTDVAAAAIDMTQQQTSLQAAIQSEAAMPRTSLFSYLGNG